MINEFKGKYYFLSNFYNAPIMYEGLLYQNNESAFQSAKVTDIEKRKQFCSKDPSTAKKKGRNVTLRHDWEKIKANVGEMIFINSDNDPCGCNDKAGRKLDTGDKELVEGNVWNDVYWGVCRGRGKNMLGKILMKVRKELRE